MTTVFFLAKLPANFWTSFMDHDLFVIVPQFAVLFYIFYKNNLFRAGRRNNREFLTFPSRKIN